MKVGTKSVLFGAHCWFIHPWFVAAAWWKLYGFPYDPRLWFCFFFHDIGYLGKPNMDGPEGETHVEIGAKIVGKLFGSKWHDFSLYHSRFYAKKNNQHYSKLCVADKLAIILMPIPIYLFLTNLTGEINEYMKLSEKRAEAGEAKYSSMNVYSDSQYQWCKNIWIYIDKWVEEHKDMKEDTWTPKM